MGQWKWYDLQLEQNKIPFYPRSLSCSKILRHWNPIFFLCERNRFFGIFVSTMEFKCLEKAVTVLPPSTKAEEAVTTNSNQNRMHTSHSLVQFWFMHLKRWWHPQKSNLSKMQCFQNRFFTGVTSGRNNRNWLMELIVLYVQIFSGFKDLLFFKKNVCISLNFDNFITRNQANDQNIRHDVVCSYWKNFVLSGQNFLLTFQHANNLASKYNTKIQMDPFLLEKIRMVLWKYFPLNGKKLSFISC